MNTPKFAIFIDLENTGAKVETLNNILEKVKIRGDILMGKVYGYTDRFSSLKELLLSNTFTVVPSLRFGVAQKNNADILLVLDALERRESCGGHFREESQTEEGEALRDDEHFCHVAAWEFRGVGETPVLHKEPLTFTNVSLAQRSYK